MMKSTLFFALAALTAAPGAFAQTATEPSTTAPDKAGEHKHGGGPRGFDAMDADHDGFVTLDEWKAAGRREERFYQIDTAHTGKITREQLRAFREKMMAEHPHAGGAANGAPPEAQ